MNVVEWQAVVIERTAGALACWIETTPEEKLNWKPEVAGAAGLRPISEMIQECIGVNGSFLKLLKGVSESVEEAQSSSESEEGSDKEKSLPMTGPALKAALLGSAEELAGVVRTMGEADLVREYDAGWAKLPGAVIIELAAGNMMYHGGQINYIQMLAGDKEFHFPESFFTWQAKTS